MATRQQNYWNHPMAQALGSPGLGQAAQGQAQWQPAAQAQSAAQQQALWNQVQNLGLTQSQMLRNQVRPPPQWVIAGQEMTLDEFVDAIWPDHQSAERSWFLLKYSNREP